MTPTSRHDQERCANRVPVVRSIPRFVTSDGYTAPFGLQWNQHAPTQLDSRTNANLSRERLEHCLGMPLKELAGLRVLEAGCSAGRFTELLVQSGALVHAVDLSGAVDANRRNVGDPPNYVVAQADLRDLPFPAGTFDVVLCLGVLQHTPSPEASIGDLWRMIAPGGSLVIDHYGWTLSHLTKLAPPARGVAGARREARGARLCITAATNGARGLWCRRGNPSVDRCLPARSLPYGFCIVTAP